MGSFRHIKGNLFDLVNKNEIDVIAQGNNCFCRQKRGIAVEFVDRYGTDNESVYWLEKKKFEGDFNKLGQIQFGYKGSLVVVNCYTQYDWNKNNKENLSQWGIPLDYHALTMCLKKINHQFPNKRIGLPKIGCGLAGGDLNKLIKIIKLTMTDCHVTLVDPDLKN